MDDCIQEVMFRYMHVLSITNLEPKVNEILTLSNQWTLKYRPWSNMDDCIQEVMLRCIQVPSITAVGPILTEKLT